MISESDFQVRLDDVPNLLGVVGLHPLVGDYPRLEHGLTTGRLEAGLRCDLANRAKCRAR